MALTPKRPESKLKGSKVSLQIRIDEYIHEKLKLIAGYEMRSLNAQLEYFLLNSIEEYFENIEDDHEE